MQNHTQTQAEASRLKIRRILLLQACLAGALEMGARELQTLWIMCWEAIQTLIMNKITNHEESAFKTVKSQLKERISPALIVFVPLIVMMLFMVCSAALLLMKITST